MPNWPMNLFRAAGYQLTGSLPWGEKPASERPGVYAVSLREDPRDSTGDAEPAFDIRAIGVWIRRVPTLTLGGHRPQPKELAEHLSLWWLAEEPILYLGKATNLHDRLGAYYRTPLGNRSPHRGGHWIKTLANLGSTWVHFAEVEEEVDPEIVENGLLGAFASRVSRQARKLHPEPSRIYPFANLKGPAGMRGHSIGRSVLP